MSASLLARAISFAARKHAYQKRKDGTTPYVAHPFRVCMLLATRFAIDEEETLAAAVLHDTIEDTTADYDDLLEQFGDRVADTVAILSKDKRLEESVREEEYVRQLGTGSLAVKQCKLADILDNLADAGRLSPEGRARQVARAVEVLDLFRADPHPALEVMAIAVEEAIETLNEGTR